MKLSNYPLLLPVFLAACGSLQNNAKNNTEDAQIVQTAENLKHSGNAAGAVALLRQAQSTHPDDPVIVSQLGYMLIAANQPQEAIGVFDHLISLNPDNASAYNGKAVALDRTGNHAAAQELYEQALKLSPASLGIKNNLAMSMILNDQIDQAIALLEELNRESGTNQTIRQNLALAYGIKGNKEKALALNKLDLPEDQSQENLRFYEQYVSEHKKSAANESKKVVASKAQPAASRTITTQAKTLPPVSVTPETATALLQDKTEKNEAAAEPVVLIPADASPAGAVVNAPVAEAKPPVPAPEIPAATAETTPSIFHSLLTPDSNSASPLKNKPSGTVLQTSATTSSTPASQKGMVAPAVATLELPTAQPEEAPAKKLPDLAPAAGKPELLQAPADNNAQDDADDNDTEAAFPSQGKR